MHNEKVFFQKAECLVKTVKKCFLKKTKYLARTYESSVLSCKLPKRTIYIYKSIFSRLGKFLYCLDN